MQIEVVGKRKCNRLTRGDRMDTSVEHLLSILGDGDYFLTKNGEAYEIGQVQFIADPIEPEPKPEPMPAPKKKKGRKA